MKVTIIGGGGRVGSNAAFALQCGGIVPEIQLLDVDTELAKGEALDLLHGTSCLGGQRIYAGDYERAKDSDMFIITAGLRRQPDESRLDLINRNVTLFSQILQDLKTTGHKDSAMVFVVSNPVDILTSLAGAFLDLPRGHVLGLGTMLDTIRFRSLIAEALEYPATQVNALILGEHGDSMVPIWSGATVGGTPLAGVKGCDVAFQNKIFGRTKGSGAEVIRRKGGAGWAVGIAIAEVVHAIALDRRQLLPVSSPQQGCYGIRDISLSVPSILGREGVVSHQQIALWPKEEQGLQASANTLKATMRKVVEAPKGAN